MVKHAAPTELNRIANLDAIDISRLRRSFGARRPVFMLVRISATFHLSANSQR